MDYTNYRTAGGFTNQLIWANYSLWLGYELHAEEQTRIEYYRGVYADGSDWRTYTVFLDWEN